MQFEKKNRRHRNINLDVGKRAGQYPTALQFYTLPPSENISLQEFEDFAVDRLKVLKAVETAGIKHIRGSEKYRDQLEHEFQVLKKQGVGLKGLLKKTSGSQKQLDVEELEDRRKDHISHFILRLAYCRSEDLKRWFLQQELDLFRYRFALESSDSIRQFLELNNLDYKPIPEDEKNNILNELISSSRDSSSHVVDKEKFYKVPFTEVLDLVRGRRVYLSNGFAYVPHSELVVIILTHYRAVLSHALAVTSRAVPHLEEDERLLPMLSNLSRRYLGADYSKTKSNAGQITADMIDALSRQSFPLCMSQMHTSLRANHHMRYGGRQQYGLFLKGIGMELSEALKFWRAEFTKAMDGDKFDKQYSYNIRHNHGQEGKRADYTPYSCMKIITSNAPGPGDAHGCPFKHTDADLLRQKLQSLKITKTGAEEIADLARRGHYQLACGRYFELTHASKMDEMDVGFSPNHPNQYFEESQKLLNGERKAAPTPRSQGTPRIVRSQSSQPSQGTPSSQPTQPVPTLAEEFDDFPMSAEEMEQAMKGVEECT